MKKFTVYIHTSPSNKYYIGITSAKNVESRWGVKGEGYKTQIFYRAIKKYGWDNFKHTIVAEGLTKKEACSMETELISKYRSNEVKYGYNISNGGECVMLGLNHTDEAKLKISERFSIPVNQYDLKGNLIKKWDSMIEAEDSGFDRSSISKCCRGEYKTSKNFVWRYDGDSFDKFSLKKYQQKKRRIEVAQFSKDMKHIRDWDSISKASSELNISSSDISSCCKGNRKTVGGFIFKYKNRGE